MSAKPIAVLDLGTNSTRFILVEPGDSGFSPDLVLDRDSVVTRLGEGIESRGQLSDQAIGRVMKQINKYDQRVGQFDGEWLGAVATSACRRAKNGDIFLDRVENQLGIRPKLISGHREAELIYTGISACFPGISSGRILDIGGGSSEWITFESNECDELESIPIGVVTVREQFGGNEQWANESINNARKAVRQSLPTTSGNGPVFVVGGTGTTLSAYKQDLTQYVPERVHGDELTVDDINAIRNEFMALTFSEMSDVPVVQKGREDVMIPGIIILEEFIKFAGEQVVTVSDYGILAGLVQDVMIDEPNG